MSMHPPFTAQLRLYRYISLTSAYTSVTRADDKLLTPLQAQAPVSEPGYAPAPGPVALPSCSGGKLPIAWNCTHLGQPFEFDADSYREAAPLARKEK